MTVNEYQDDYSYFMTAKDTSVLKNLSDMGAHLAELKKKMEAANAAADLAKSEFEHYANSILPSAMHSAGVESIELADGSKMSVVRNYYCSPNKNTEDRELLRNWLTANGGDHLIKVQATVKDTDALEAAGIAYVKSADVNTTSLKAFLKDKLGITSGIAQISMQDIPQCVHFQEVTTIKID